MKIVHVIDYFQPKLGYQETFLAKEHAKLGHDVYVVTSDRYNPIVYSGDAAKPVMGNRIVGSGFFIEEGIKVWRLKTLFEISHEIWMRGLGKKIRELEPDIVIVHGVVNFFAIRIARLKKKLNFKLIYDDHMTFDNSRSPMRILYPLFRLTFSHLIQENADALVGVADACKVFMNQKYGIPLRKITVITLGADHELFRFNLVARKEIRTQLSLNEKDVVFIYTGKIISNKRLSILVEATAKLMEKHDSVKVLLVGDGATDYIEKLKQDIRTRNLQDIFIWRNAVPNKELYEFYSAADVAVWPRGASIGQREAMACGLPIIISECSMVTELVDYDNGLICQEDDTSDLAQQMGKLVNPELRKEMGANSRKCVDGKLNWRIIARQFIELVEEK